MARLLLVAALLLLSGCHAMYLPGVAPHEYQDGDEVKLKVNKLDSIKRPLVAYSYYKLPFCPPPNGIHNAAENLGEHLTGETIQNSGYHIQMNVNSTCNILCERKYDAHAVSLFLGPITQQYSVNWIVDNLPAAATGITVDHSVLYSRGFPIGGRTADNAFFLYNHVRITLKFHSSPDYDGKRIVGFDVHPMTVRHAIDDSTTPHTIMHCDRHSGILPSETHESMYITGSDAANVVKVAWTYDVFWVRSNVRWASRWDIYLSMGDRYSSDIHWYSIINSMIIVVFLTGMVAMILVRALYRDLSRYNRVATDEEKAEDREETGWKLVHGDVFRPPVRMPVLFAVFVGVGSQLLGMAAATLLFAAVGFLNPANRGSLMVGLLLLFLLMGIGAGYTAARTHKMLNGVTYQRTTLLVAFGFPGLVFLTLFVLNLFVWHAGSVDAISFGSMFAVLALWMVVSVPLVFVGAYYGFKKEKLTFPVATSSIPRQVPPQPWYFSTSLVMAVGGVLPFGAVFVELFFILASLWLDQYYYVFGFLLLVFIILAVTCAEISVVLVYFQLCAENYHWWWRSALVPGASGLYLFLYTIFFYSARLNITDFTSSVLYFGYSFLLSVCFGIMTGVIGHLATLAFTRKIYSAIKVD